MWKPPWHNFASGGTSKSHPDTADVATVEEFYRPRYLFQLTAEGEAAERAIAFYDEMLPSGRTSDGCAGRYR